MAAVTTPGTNTQIALATTLRAISSSTTANLGLPSLCSPTNGIMQKSTSALIQQPQDQLDLEGDSDNNDGFNTGRWAAEEHKRFLAGLDQFG